jgi:hypothetical protein
MPVRRFNLKKRAVQKKESLQSGEKSKLFQRFVIPAPYQACLSADRYGINSGGNPDAVPSKEGNHIHTNALDTRSPIVVEDKLHGYDSYLNLPVVMCMVSLII